MGARGGAREHANSRIRGYSALWAEHPRPSPGAFAQIRVFSLRFLSFPPKSSPFTQVQPKIPSPALENLVHVPPLALPGAMLGAAAGGASAQSAASRLASRIEDPAQVGGLRGFVGVLGSSRGARGRWDLAESASADQAMSACAPSATVFVGS